MDTKFTDLIATGHVVIYLNNILIFATTLDKLVFYMHKVLKCLQELDLFLRPAKCSFNQTLVEYLGLIISEGELHMDPVKLQVVKDWPCPKSVKDIQTFLGFCNIYRRFIHAYSTLVCPLFDLTKKTTTWTWTPVCEAAFTGLQLVLQAAKPTFLRHLQ